MSALVRRAYETICRCWVMEAAHLPSFLRCLQETGFEDIQVEDVSWRAAPSVAHVPWVSLRFLLREGRHGLTEQRKNNLLAPIIMLLLGMARRRFGYYHISASVNPVTALVAPGPLVTSTTPTLPVERA